MLNKPRWSTLTLSRGTVLDNYWPSIGDDFPPNSETRIDFYDTAGNVIYSAEGVVEPKRLTYLVDQVAKLDLVPQGGQYELWVVANDFPYKYEYGRIARREAAFYTPPPTLIAPNESRLFIDKFGRNTIGRKWIPTWGGVAMHQLGDRWGMGPDIGLLFREAAVRYYRPLGSDSFRVKFEVASSGSAVGMAGNGKMQFLAGTDITTHTGFGFEIETGISNDKLHTGIVSAPTDLDYNNTINSNTVDEDTFTVEYSDITGLYRVFKNDAIDPIISWPDTERELARGPGYRYFSFAWDASLVATGPLVTAVEIQDMV